MKNKIKQLGVLLALAFIAPMMRAQTPVSNFSLSQNIVCSGEVVQITDNSSDSPNAWVYVVDGLTLTTQNPTVSFASAGVFTISLEAENVNGPGTVYTETVLVNALPSLTVTPTSPMVCFGDNVALTCSGATSYTWTGGITNGVDFAPTATSAYTVTAEDANGCTEVMDYTVTVNALPILSISGISAVCLGGSITLTVSGADTYVWSTSSTSDVLTESPSSNTTYTVAGFDAITGCSNTITSPVVVHALPSLTVSSGSICIGGSFTITPTGASSYTYSSGSDIVTPVSDASYSITGTDVNGCVSAEEVITVTVNALPIIGVSNATICEGTSFTITPSGASSYTISGGSDVVAPISNTMYTIDGTDANGCVSASSATCDILVNAAPLISSNSGVICAGDNFTIVASGAVTYTVSGGNDVVSPLASTAYTVTGTDALGCISTLGAISDVTVNALPVISVNSGIICMGNSFTISPIGALSYTYSDGSDIVAPTTNTMYTVTGTDANGCIGTTVSNVTVNALPVVSISDATICAGSNFTMSPTGAVNYTYSSGSNIVAPVTNTFYTIDGADAAGCTSAVSATVNVTINTLPVISVNNGVICLGNNFIITATGANTYTYAGGGSNIFAPTTNTFYSVSGTDANGCVSAPVISNVTVNALPAISVNSGAVCSGNSFTMTATGAVNYTYSSGTNIVTPVTNTFYTVSGTDANGCVSNVSATANVTVNALPLISVNSGAICAGLSFTIIPTGASTYTYSSGSNIVSPMTNTVYNVTGTDANGCESAIAAISNVTVNALPVVTVNSGAICMGGSFTIVPAGASTYTITGGNNVVSPATTTVYNVTGTDANGCESSVAAISNVTVNALPVVSISTTTNAICEGQSLVLTGAGASTYSWSTNTLSNNISVNPMVTTTYSVTGTDQNGCEGITTKVITVNALPTLTVTPTTAVICAGEEVMIIVTGANTYLWNDNSTNASFVTILQTTTTFSVVGTNAAGCSSEAVVTQSVSECTGISNNFNSAIEVKVYPNPTNGNFVVQLESAAHARIIAADGREVYNQDLNSGSNNINVEQLPNGAYILQLLSADKHGFVKLIKAE